MKQIFQKLFCLHKWETHAKKEDYRLQETTEVLICNCCGTIRILKY